MQSVLILNAKGGSGKTTIATNLAALYASSNFNTAIIDYDPQGSSHFWGILRESTEQPPIHIIDASHKRTGITRSFQLSTPSETERVVIDTPAGISQLLLCEAIARADLIIIPITPSPADIHATAGFVRDLLVTVKSRARGMPICVIANRGRQRTPLYPPLKEFLGSLEVPFITTLSDSERYIDAAASGIGIHEMEASLATQEREEWVPLVKWIAQNLPHIPQTDESLPLRVASNR